MKTRLYCFAFLFWYSLLLQVMIPLNVNFPVKSKDLVVQMEKKVNKKFDIIYLLNIYNTIFFD
jgi:hypothetical protein